MILSFQPFYLLEGDLSAGGVLHENAAEDDRLVDAGGLGRSANGVLLQGEVVLAESSEVCRSLLALLVSLSQANSNSPFATGSVTCLRGSFPVLWKTWTVLCGQYVSHLVFITR